jgi:myo-inositol-1(or 4)-monophosphatase
MDETAPPTLSVLLDQATVAVEDACTLIRRMVDQPVASWDKDDHSPVTAIDLAVDELLKARLGALDPKAGWLSEETADRPERLAASRVWVVDPIDGTRALLEGLPEYCVSVALVSDGGRPVLGIIANPSTGQRFHALTGQGAWDDHGRRLQVAGAVPESGVRLLVSRSEMGRGMWREFGAAMTVEACSGLAWKMARVACGEADATLTPWRRSEWDAAAGDLILAEAGGWSADLVGQALNYNQARPFFRGVSCGSAAARERVFELARRVEKQREHLVTLWRRGR